MSWSGYLDMARGTRRVSRVVPGGLVTGGAEFGTVPGTLRRQAECDIGRVDLCYARDSLRHTFGTLGHS